MITMCIMTDYLWGVLTGAALVLLLILAVVVYFAWED